VERDARLASEVSATEGALLNGPVTWRERLLAIARLRCPACGEGRIFRGVFATNERCPVCDLLFLREPGYFLGAMYFSYALGIPLILAFTLAAYLLLPQWRLYQQVLLACTFFLPLVPAVYRYSRVMWIHFDRFFDPD
jgi:uncharacterized protein (DUF983 family)